LANDHETRGALLFVFNNDSRMSGLNYQFKGKNRPTDVLAFNLAENYTNNYIEGEIYVNLQMARRQAVSYGVAYLEEVTRLCLHGFLHLLGYDDIKAANKEKMWQVQEDYLATYF
jgi:probable rRNA maturation factor